MRILIVEDEKKTAAYLKKGLSESGFVVDVVEQGEDGLHLARTGDYDLILLDVMLPQQDGWSILTEMRRSGKQTPILFVTARDSIQDRVKGLDWVRTITWSSLSPSRNCWRGFAPSFAAARPDSPKCCASQTWRSTSYGTGCCGVESVLT
jgi:CheY-like chemotaxis protein